MSDAAAASLRVFFGLPVDAALAPRLAALASRIAAAARGRAVPAANLHATLVFVGAISPAQLSGLAAIGARIAASTKSVLPVVTLDRVGSFRRAGVAFADATSVPEPLLALRESLAAALGAAAWRVEARPFHLHVTLARHCRQVLDEAATEPLAWQADALVLFESVPSTEGPVYEARGRWPLGRR